MKIVHFDEMFHPDFGYQINVLPKFQKKQGHEVIIITSEKIEKHPIFSGFSNSNSEDIELKDREYERKTGVKVIRLPIWGVYSGRVVFKRGFLKYVDELIPDVVFCHFHDTLAGIAFVKHVKKAEYPIVFDSHMLKMASKNPLKKLHQLFYKTFITPSIIKNNSIVIRTQNDPYVEECLGIPLSQAPFISFGTDTSIFKPSNEVRNLYKKELGLDNEFVIVCTGKLTEAKGGMLLAKALKEKYECNRDVVFIVIGNSYGEYGEKVEKELRSSENKIIRLTTQRYIDLPKFYQIADLCVFAKQCSLSFYDAQACKLPVISEDNNVNIDRLKHNNGFNFKSGDVNDLRKKISKCIDMDKEEYEEMKKSAYIYVKENYNYEHIAREYTKILLSEYKRKQIKK